MIKKLLIILLFFSALVLNANVNIERNNIVYDILNIEKTCLNYENKTNVINLLNEVIDTLSNKKIETASELLKESYKIIEAKTKILGANSLISEENETVNNKLLLSEFFSDNEFYVDCDTASFLYASILEHFNYDYNFVLLNAHAMLYLPKEKLYFESLNGKILSDLSSAEYKNVLSFYLLVEKKNIISVAYYNVGIYYLLKNDYNNAINNFQKSITLEKRSYYPYLHQGIALFHLEKYDEALVFFKKTVELVNSDFAYYCLAMCEQQLNQFEEAINHYSMAIKIKKNVPSYYFSRAITYIITNRFKNAYIDIKSLLIFVPTSGLAYQIKGTIDFQLKNYKEAIIDFKNAIAKDFSYDDIYKSNGSITMKAAFNDDVVNDIKTETFFLMGLSYQNLRNYNEALNYYKKAKDLNYSKDKIDYQLTVCNFEQNNFNKVIESSQDISLEIKKENNFYFYMLGVSYFKIGNFNEALINLEYAMASGYDLSAVLKAKLEIYFEQEDYEKSLLQLNKLVLIEQDNFNIYYTRGLNYLKLKKYDEAKNDFIKAKQLDINGELQPDLDDILKNFS